MSHSLQIAEVPTTPLAVWEDRDPAFWSAVYEHPEVKPHVGLGQDLDMSAIVANPAVTPLRAAHGGFLFARLDAIGRIFELHTMFTPEGWGREVLNAARAAHDEIFRRGCQIVTTFEVAGNRRSQPPLSFRFQPAGPFEMAAEFGVEFRTWFLTRAAWMASPAHRSM